MNMVYQTVHRCFFCRAFKAEDVSTRLDSIDRRQDAGRQRVRLVI